MSSQHSIHQPYPQPLCVQLLGEFRVSYAGQEVASGEWHLRNAEHLVKLIALSPGLRLHRDVLIDQLWPELDPLAASNNLRYALYMARRTLRSIIDEDVIHREGEQLVLRATHGVVVDATMFSTAASAARKSGDVTAYERAIVIYRGDLLPGDRYEDWTVHRRDELRATCVSLLLEAATLLDANGSDNDALRLLQQVVELDSASEEAHQGLMRLYARRSQHQRALRQYGHLQEALRRELDIDPDPTSQRLYQDILIAHAGRAAKSETLENAEESVEAPHHNLPVPLTSFIGREQEINELHEHLRNARLITLTGAGGCGKTRLAIEVARRVIDNYPDGVWMVDLASLVEPELLPKTIAVVLGISEDRNRSTLEVILDALSSQKLLIVLDNCEHLAVDCAGLLSTLLRACPGVRILATSRTRLRVDGELTWQVPSLDVPGEFDHSSIAGIQQFDSVRLFAERAAFARQDFKLSETNAPAICRICRHLDGLPLAIELAASRVTVLTPDQLASRLGDSLRMLSGGRHATSNRHQTMRATIDWSYNLLPDSVRTVLHRVSVFAGGWSLEAVEFIADGAATDDQDLLDILTELVDRSLVVVEAEDDQARYRLLETVRQYAAERLVASGEAEQIRRRHAEYFLALTEESQSDFTGPVRAVWLRRVERELDNLRAALRWSLDGDDIDLGMRLGAALGDFWFVNGRQSEGRAWLSSLLAHPAARAPDVLDLRTTVIAASFILAYRQGDYLAALALAEECLEIHRCRDDKRGIAWALSSLSMPVGELGDLDRSEALLEESLSVSRELGDTFSIARALDTLGELNRFRGDYRRARDLYTESRDLFLQLDARPHLAIVSHNLGQVALALNEPAEAVRWLRDGLARYQELEHIHGKIFCLAGLAGAATMLGNCELATRLFGAVDALRKANNLSSDAADRVQQQRHLAELRDSLGDTNFQRTWEAGTRLSLEDAIDQAITIKADHRAAAAPAPVELSRREREIAALIAHGCTNQRIAHELEIAQRTADTHVSRILRKLGFSSRTQVAEWARRRNQASD